MKKIILALLLTAVAIPAQAQFQGVTTTANGTLHSPTNFWAANSLAIANGLPLAAPGVARGLISNGTQTIGGNKTFTNDVSVQGNTVLGDASGDTLTISGTITAANANGTAANSVANVGTLDARYRGIQSLLNPISSPLRFGNTLVETANSGAPWANWARINNNSWVELQLTLAGSSPAGWSRGGFYNFGQIPGASSVTPTSRAFTFLALSDMPEYVTGNPSTTFYFGAQGTEQGQALAARGLRVTFSGNGTFSVTAAIHDGTSEITGTGTVTGTNIRGGIAIRWLPVGGGTPGAGSRLEVWGRPMNGNYSQICAAELTGSIGSTGFAGSMFLVAASMESTSPGFTAYWTIGGCTTYWH
jgi:hypothetical protein